MTVARFAKGEVVFHHFEIISELGSGSSGSVYQVRDRRTPTLVYALKAVPKQALSNPLSQLRLARECLALEWINSPRVAWFHSLLHSYFGFGILMEFVRGVALDEVIDASGVHGVSRHELFFDLLQGVKVLHAAGVVHGDLKPSNLILRPTRQVCLIDLGLVTPTAQSKIETFEILSKTSARFSLSGTPLYMAPELYQGERPTVQADLYSLGVLAAQVVAGQLPFELRDLRALHRDKCGKNFTSQFRDRAGESISFYERALDPDPKRRFRDVDELWRALWEVTRASQPLRKLPAAKKIPLYRREANRLRASMRVLLTFVGLSQWGARFQGRLSSGRMRTGQRVMFSALGGFALFLIVLGGVLSFADPDNSIFREFRHFFGSAKSTILGEKPSEYRSFTPAKGSSEVLRSKEKR